MPDDIQLTRRALLARIAAAPLLSLGATAAGGPLSANAQAQQVSTVAPVERSIDTANDTGTLSGKAFGTHWRLDAPAGAVLERLRPHIEALFDSIDRQQSPWRRDSTLSRFNAARAGKHVVDPECLHVIRAALDLASRTRGAFDPTIGPLVARWGFGPITSGGAPDWHAVSINANHIVKARDDLTLDLCGIAKGRALDRAVALCRDAGMDELLFDLGGELRALGNHPSGRAWQVAVQHPEPGHPAAAVVRLPAGRAIATTSLAQQSYNLAGQRYGHIVNPETQRPASSGLSSVTVVSDDAMSADGWATALFAAGVGSGVALANEYKLDALLLIDDGNTLQQYKAGSIERLLA